jgi:hypothetical protein
MGKSNSPARSVLKFGEGVLGTVILTIVPLLGCWLASSLAAFYNRSKAGAIVATLMAFPVVPLAWELWSRRRTSSRSKSKTNQPGLPTPPASPSLLSFWDRFVLRSLALNLSIILILLVFFPQASFRALATRGDWMLDHSRASWTPKARQTLVKAAGCLEWLYKATKDDPYKQFEPTEQEHVVPEANDFIGIVEIAKQQANKDQKQPNAPPSTTDKEWEKQAWPSAAKLHPLVTSIPPSEEKDYQSVAKYIAAHETRPFERIKALHDYVADRIQYDAVAYEDRVIPSQEADVVFASKKSVCAGYAKLMAAMGKEIGEKIMYVSGMARSSQGDGEGHAWNAAQIKGKWYLIDSTWDSGYVKGRTFHKNYRTSYLFVPPEVIGITHIPNDSKWQLREHPISRAVYLRQPILKPTFFMAGMQLESPQQGVLEVDSMFQATFKNPNQYFLSAAFVENGTSEQKRCTIHQGTEAQLECTFPKNGTYKVTFFGNKKEFGTYNEYGNFLVHHR